MTCCFFEELWRRHARLVFGRCYASIQNPAVAEELTADTFVKAWSALPAYHSGHFQHWLLTIARRLCINHLKSAHTVHEVAVGFEYERMTDDPTPEQQAIDAQLLRFVHELPPKQRVAIKLFYLDGHSYKDIGRITGDSLKSVKSHIYTGVRNLRVKCEAARQGAGK